MLGWLAVALAAPTPEDVAGLARVEDVTLSLDGRQLAWTLRTARPPAAEAEDPAWKVETQLWLARDGGAPRQLTFGADAHAPGFSPDGTALAFLRAHEGKVRLQVLPLDGGEARVVDTGELEPAAFAWAPDGRSIAFTARAPEDEAVKRARERDGGVERIGEFPRDLLWTVALEGGPPERIGGEDRHVVELAYAPDGGRIAVVTAASGDPYEAMLLRRLQVVTLADGAFRPIDDRPRVITSPQFSPDGTKLAWIATNGTLTLQNALHVAAADGSGRIDVAEGRDLTIDTFAWAGSAALVALVTERTRTVALRLAADGSASERLAGVADRTVLADLAGSADGARFATIASSPVVPGEPAWFEPGGGSAIVAHPNDVSGWALGPTEVFGWKGPGGARLEGVITWPAERSGPVPLLVMPHGGPDGVSLEGFEPSAQWFASRGYAVFRPNYRGGLGYGRDFYAANRGKLGAIEFGDIEAGVDALIRAGRVDRERLVYGGWSWGGYLTAWTIGHTDRYRAAVAGAAVVDTVSHYALSDINHGVAAQWEYLGDPWREPQRFAKSNPMLSLHRARTPTLVIHGRADERVDFSAARILYRALADMGCEVELYAYPGEPHGFQDPRHVAHVLRSWADWYDRHLGATLTSSRDR